MHRAELIHLDRPADARWEIPAERMKARRSHVVPLPPLAREIILRQLASNDHRGEGFVFASRFADKQRLARHSLSQAVKRVIAALSPGGSDGATIRALRAKPPTPHDFRRTLATRLAEFGIPREDRLAILAHSWGDVHGSHYDRYERLREKRVALEAWDRHVAELLGLRRQAVLICERQQVRAAG